MITGETSGETDAYLEYIAKTISAVLTNALDSP